MTAIHESPQTTAPEILSTDDAPPPRWRQGVGSGRLEYWTFADSNSVLGLVGNRTDEPDKYTAELQGRLRRYNLSPGPLRTLWEAQVAVERVWLRHLRYAGISASPGDPSANSPASARQPASTTDTAPTKAAAPTLRLEIRVGLLFGGVRPYLEPEEYVRISRRLAETGEGSPWGSFADFGSAPP